jgi:hypothetical protein
MEEIIKALAEFVLVSDLCKSAENELESEVRADEKCEKELKEFESYPICEKLWNDKVRLRTELVELLGIDLGKFE